MKISNKIIENFVYNQKRRAYSGALSSEKYRIYNHPTEEDRKLYHSIRFTYKKHTRIKQKRCVEAKLYMEPNIKDVNIYNKLIDECMYSTENNDSDYESGDERIKLKINESSDEEEIEFKNHRFSQNNLKTNVLETTVKEKKRGKIQKIFKNLNETNKAIWQPIFLLKLDEIIIQLWELAFKVFVWLRLLSNAFSLPSVRPNATFFNINNFNCYVGNVKKYAIKL